MNEDKAARYHRAQRTTFWIALALCVPALIALLPGGAAVALREWLVRATALSATSPLTAVLFALSLLALVEVIELPVTVYRSRLERRYAAVLERPRATALDRIKSVGVNAAVVSAGTFVAYAALALSPTWWWVIAAAVAAGARALIGHRTNIYPPTFFRCRILRRSTLRDRLEALGARAGVHSLDVYEWSPDAGTVQTNARLMGAGDRCRILLSTNLLADFSPDEVEVIVAHELGHHVHRDLRNGNRLRTVLTLVTAGVAAAALDVMWRPLGLTAPNDAAGWPILVAAAAVVRTVTEPLVKGVSRRMELRADRFAMTLTGRPDVFASTLRRLADRHLAETRPSLSTVWLFHSHPTVEQRIHAARS